MTVSRPVYLDVKHSSGAQGHIHICYCQTAACLWMWGALSNERTSLSFTIAVGPRQSSHSRVQVPWDSSYFTVSDSGLPQLGVPGPRIHISHEQGGPVMKPGNGFPFRRLLRLAGLWWRYTNPPLHGLTIRRYIVSILKALLSNRQINNGTTILFLEEKMPLT
jgi:hypothetical protein